MQIDHGFIIGTHHARSGVPCQDYGLSGPLGDGEAFGAVADGCSGANAHTDVGARVLCHAFEHALKTLVTPGQPLGWGTAVRETLEQAFRQRRISAARNDYFATLVGFRATPAHLEMFLFGDGAFLLKDRHGIYMLVQRECADNAPYYLNYRLESDLDAAYRTSLAGREDRAAWETTTRFRVSESREVTILTQTSRFLSLEEVALGSYYLYPHGPLELEWAVVLSDGVAQFPGQDVIAMAHTLTAFKTHQGEFVKRRLLRALRDLGKQGIAPTDDVAICGVYFDKEPGHGDEDHLSAR